MRARPPQVIILLVAAAALVPISGAEHGDRETYNVLVAPTPFAMVCSGDSPYLPQGEPGDYGIGADWLLSGDPECLVGDTLFGTENGHGVGGVVSYAMAAEYAAPNVGVRNHLGDLATVTATDDRFANGPHFMISIAESDESTLQIESCGGSVSFIVPNHNESPWQAVEAAYLRLLVFLHHHVAVMDDFTVCLSSMGQVDIAYAPLD